MKKSITSEEYRVFLRLLVECRERSRLTQAQLAERLNENQSFISKIERGERRIDIVELLAFCDALNISAVDFLVALEQAINLALEN